MLDLMKEILKHLLEPSRLVLCTVLTITAPIVLFPTLRAALRVEPLFDQYPYAFILLSLYSLIFLCYDCAIPVRRRMKMWLDAKRQNAYLLRTLRELPQNEQELLSFFLAQPCDVVWLPAEDSTVISLLDKGFLYYAQSLSALKHLKSNTSAIDNCWACAMKPALRRLIKQSSRSFAGPEVSAANRRRWEYVQEAC